MSLYEFIITSKNFQLKLVSAKFLLLNDHSIFTMVELPEAVDELPNQEFPGRDISSWAGAKWDCTWTSVVVNQHLQQPPHTKIHREAKIPMSREIARGQNTR